MLVKELIELLKQQPQDLAIVLYDPDAGLVYAGQCTLQDRYGEKVVEIS